ncbi:hypothetical protein [Brachybacterium massiliense]|uniref:hypothetical protein n=1 Tax=Brachybacterium massiliense TaxID=1755098 RepID=UPI000B3BC6A5|nr:hypothetical protein [Brachybacterium massiliense]
MTKAEEPGVRVPWAAIYRDWPTVVVDLAQTYHVHWHQALAWPWPVIRGYVEGLFTEPSSRVYRTHIQPLVKG